MSERKRNNNIVNTINTLDKRKQANTVDFDHLVLSAGEFGKYQLFLFLCTFPFYVFAVFIYFSQLFMTETAPNHWCWVPELENLTIIQRRNLAIPQDLNSEYGYSRCHVYEANWTEVLASGAHPNSSWKTVACKNGWEFNKTEFPYPTIASEMGWVCDKDSYQATSQSIFFLGSIVGGFLVGYVADRFGRLPAAVFSNMIGAIAGIASAFTSNFILFTVFRFFMGMAYDNCMMMPYLIVLEYVSPKYRTLISNLAFAIFYTSGVVALPWIALACGHWITLAFATSIPPLLSILAPFILPESPRWLLSKGRIDEAVERVLRIAKVNKKEIPQAIIENFKEGVLNNKEESGNIMDLLKRPILRKIFICACVEFMCSMIIFDSLIRTIGQLQFDYFVSFSLISLTELPSLVIISLSLDFIGRKLMIVSSFILCFIVSFMVPFMPGVPSLICAIIARFAINMACVTTMQWAAEILPTSVRGSGTSIVHICSYIATVISPFVAYLVSYKPWLPMVVIGCIGVAGTLLGFMLPETAGRDMPQTFEDAENIITNQGFFEIPFLQSKNAKKNQQGRANDSFEL